MKHVFDILKKNDLSGRAATASFYLILSFFPFLIFILTLLSPFLAEDVSNDRTLQLILPTIVYQLIENAVDEASELSGNGAAVSISILTYIWASSLGVNALIKSISNIFLCSEKYNYFVLRLKSLTVTLIFSMIICISASILFFFQTIVRYLLCLSYMIIMLSFLYYASLPPKTIKFGMVLPGAVFTTVGWTIFSTFFSWYFTNISSYTKLYGGIGVLIGALIWLYLSCYILLLGAVFSAWFNVSGAP